MSNLSQRVITAKYLRLGSSGFALVSCFQQVAQTSDAITVEIVRDIECEI